MRAYQVHEVVGWEWCNAKYDEEGDKVISLALNFDGPFLQTVSQFRNREDSGPEGGADEITQ